MHGAEAREDGAAARDLDGLYRRILPDPFQAAQTGKHTHDLLALVVPPDPALGARASRLAPLGSPALALEGGMAPSRVFARPAEGRHEDVERAREVASPALGLAPAAHRDAHDQVDAASLGIGGGHHGDHL